MALRFIDRYTLASGTQPLADAADGACCAPSQPVSAPSAGELQAPGCAPQSPGNADGQAAGPGPVMADRPPVCGPDHDEAPTRSVLPNPGPLQRLPVRQLASLDDTALSARLDLVADRRVWLEKYGAPADAAELRGLQAEVRWCCDQRPAVFDGLLLPATSPNLTSAPSPNVTSATRQNPTLTQLHSQPANGAKLDRWLMRTAGSDRQAPYPVTLTAADLESAGWDAMTADRLAAALAIPVSPGTRLGAAVITDPEKWRRALSADAMRGPNGPRAVGLLSDLQATEALPMETPAHEFRPGDLAELPAIGQHTPPEHWEAIGGDAAVLPLAGEGVRFRLWAAVRLFNRDGPTRGPWAAEYRAMWQRHGGRID